MKKLLSALLPLFVLTACVGSNNNQNPTNNSTLNSGTLANINTAIDPTTIGFAANFAAQHADLQIAFAPYYESGSQHSPGECSNAQDIYATTIAPIMKVSESSTLNSLWNSDEYFNCSAGITKLVVASIKTVSPDSRP